MKLETLCRTDVPSIDAHEALTEVASRMLFDEISSLVVFEDGRFVGIITERDLARAMADGVDPEETSVARYMTEDPVVASFDMECGEAKTRMLDLGIRHLPVVAGGMLVGIVSARDLLADAATDGGGG